MAKDRAPTDWEAIEREYRAGQVSVRAIASAHGITEGAIRKKAKAENWQRALADTVRRLVREKLVREDGTQAERASDAEVAEAAARIGVGVQLSHRKDLNQLRAIGAILADRLASHLTGAPVDGPFIGDKECPSDLFEKLARVKARLIPLERQAFNLDAPLEDAAADDQKVSARERIASRILGLAARSGQAGDTGGTQ